MRAAQPPSLCTGSLLRTIVFPAAVHSAVMDPSEHSLRVGSADGRIFQVSLVRVTTKYWQQGVTFAYVMRFAVCRAAVQTEGLLLLHHICSVASHLGRGPTMSCPLGDSAETHCDLSCIDVCLCASMQVGRAVESESLDTAAAADISMQAHDREWTPLHGHTHAVTSLAYTVDGMFMLSGYALTVLPLTLCPWCGTKGLRHLRWQVS